MNTGIEIKVYTRGTKWCKKELPHSLFFFRLLAPYIYTRGHKTFKVRNVRNE